MLIKPDEDAGAGGLRASPDRWLGANVRKGARDGTYVVIIPRKPVRVCGRH
ncbi:hypothetical protein [Fodinicola feengrottensis]|uniref:hypothetical protein n=1 Tax=Fodinicola feengrottensis TaxID=435914 RepID=UPI0024410220|nr:hypothetical protein [Fodinicola feengrottensis]